MTPGGKKFLFAGIAGGGLLLLLSRKDANAAQSPTFPSNPVGPIGPVIPPTPSSSPPPQVSLAVQVASHLQSLITQAGSVEKAKGRENKQLIANFQAQEGLTADGLYGPNTRAALAKYINNPPLPMYFPKGSSSAAQIVSEQGNTSNPFQTLAGKKYLITFSTADGKPFSQNAINEIERLNGSLVEASGNQAAFSVQAKSNQALSPSPVNMGGQKVLIQRVEAV